MIETHTSYLLQDFYRLQPGMEAKADVVAEYRCKRFVTDMFYEHRIQSIINYHAVVLGQRVTKTEARSMTLTEEQYLQVNTKIWFLFTLSWFNLLH
jgi:hypothetical protein